MECFLSCKQIQELTIILSKLNIELQNRIKQNYDILIFQATWVGLLNSALDIVDLNMDDLKNIASKTKSKTTLQYTHIEKQSNTLAKIRRAIHQIQICSSLINLIKKREKHKDISSQLVLRSKIELLLEKNNMKRLGFIQNELNKEISIT